jgi:hypothetical protein
LNQDVDFCAQPKIPTTNDKRTIHFPGFLILDISTVYQTFSALLLNQDSQLSWGRGFCQLGIGSWALLFGGWTRFIWLLHIWAKGL